MSVHIPELLTAITLGFKEERIPIRKPENTATFNQNTKAPMFLTDMEIGFSICCWEEDKAVIRKDNLLETELPDGTKGLLFIVQPPHDWKTDEEFDAPICPLALGLGMIVNGQGYFTKSKKIAKDIREKLAV